MSCIAFSPQEESVSAVKNSDYNGCKSHFFLHFLTGYNDLTLGVFVVKYDLADLGENYFSGVRVLDAYNRCCDRRLDVALLEGKGRYFPYCSLSALSPCSSRAAECRILRSFQM